MSGVNKLELRIVFCLLPFGLSAFLLPPIQTSAVNEQKYVITILLINTYNLLLTTYNPTFLTFAHGYNK